MARTARQRSADAKLLAAATVGVLMVGVLIAGGIFIATRNTHSAVCGQLNVGDAAAIRTDLDQGGPYFQTGGGRCGFWLALDDGDIVAYRVLQPDGCTLTLKRGEWRCGGRTRDPARLARYPVSLATLDGVDTIVVDLRDPRTTTTRSTSTTTPTTTPAS